MTRPLLSPGGKRKVEKEERDCQTLAQAVRKAEDKRKAKEEQGKRDTEHAKREKEEKERKKQEEQERQKKKRKKENARNERNKQGWRTP